MLIDKKVVCGAPFVSVNFSPRGFQVCCRHEREHYQYPTVEAWLASPELKAFQQDMLAGKIDDICRLCSAGGWHAGFGMYEPTRALADGELQLVNFYISDDCQLACRPCSPQYSKTMNGFRAKAGLNTVPTQVRPYDVKDVVLEINRRGTVVSLIAGGDPVYSEAHKQAISLLRRDTELRLITNGMLWDQEFYDLVMEFAGGFVTFSIDGPTPVNEYMRTFARSSRIYDNVAKWLTLIDGRANFNTYIGVTLSNVTIWTLDLLAQELLDRFPNHADEIEFGHTLVTYPAYFTPHNLPAHLRAQVLAKLRSDLAHADGMGRPGSRFNKTYRRVVEHSIKLVEQYPFNPKDWTDFIKFNAQYDRHLPPAVAPLEWLCALQLSTTSSASS